MKVSKKITWLALALTLAFVAVIGAMWLRASRTPPQIISLPNGDRYRFVGTTWGTNHSQPRVLARILDRLPDSLANFARRKLEPRLGMLSPVITSEPALAVWFVAMGTNTGPVSFYSTRLADDSGVEAGNQGTAAFGGGESSFNTFFKLIPRRSRTLRVMIHFTTPNAPTLPVAQITFPNPLYGQFPQWQPEPLPSVKTNGDLQFQLTEFTNGESKSTVDFKGTLTPRGADSNYWVLDRFELGDATGNVIRSHVSGVSHAVPARVQLPASSSFDISQQDFSQRFWPGESAWRLKLIFKRAAGFTSQDLVAFKQVPVPAIGTTNQLRLTNSIGPARIVLTDFVLAPRPTARGSQFRSIGLNLSGFPADSALDLFSITGPQGMPVDIQAGLMDNPSSLRFFAQPSVTNFDIVFVLQKTRSVEFLVKPPAPKPPVTDAPTP